LSAAEPQPKKQGHEKHEKPQKEARREGGARGRTGDESRAPVFSMELPMPSSRAGWFD